MKTFKATFFLVLLTSCHFDVDVTKRYQVYFDDVTYSTYQKGLDAYESGNHLKADSLLSIVIENSKNKLSIATPIEFNPYYYRGHNNMELDKYKEAINDFEHVASDTTTDKDILLARSEAYKMLADYNKAILICDKLLALQADSIMVLSQRGVCFYLQGQKDKACSDFSKSKQLGGDTSYLNRFLINCK